MAHTKNIVAAVAAVSTVFLLLGAASAQQQGVRYCGLDFARAVFNQCAMAKRTNPDGFPGSSSLAGRYPAHNTGYEQADDLPIGWYEVARLGAERVRPSLTDIIFSNRFRRSVNRADLPVGQLCCVYGCTKAELASVC